MNLKRTLLAAMILILTLTSAHAATGSRGIKRKPQEPRLALVIGNGAYRSAPLKNPANDARDIAAALRKLGFTVILKLDQDREGMIRAIGEFGEQVKKVRIGLFYFSGHGIQVDGINYLLPVDATIMSEDEVPFEAVRANRVLTKMETAANPVNILVLDACRNNPYLKSWNKSLGQKGLARMNAPDDTLILYATKPGGIAKDGAGGNSPFTESLIRWMKTPGMELLQLAREVSADVRRATGNEQSPWMEGMILSEFVFNPKPIPPENPLQETPATHLKPPVHQNPPPQQTPPEPGILTVAVAPEGIPASVWINGRNFGTERRFTIRTPGIYEIRVTAEGYEPFSWSRHLASQGNRLVTARLKRLQWTPPPPRKKTTRDPVTGMDLVWVEGGCYAMGCDRRTDPACGRDEQPVHQVCLDGFWMGRCEVTAAQWHRFVTDTRYPGNGTNRNGCGIMGGGRTSPPYQQPVACVSRAEADTFARWLSKRTGKRYRLPTEAEWEYAARSGGRLTRALTGPLDRLAWYAGNSGGGPQPVGRKAENSFGLCDMLGNVWEWCADDYSGEAYKAHPSKNPLFRQKTIPSAVLRGGGWSDRDYQCRETARLGLAPEDRNPMVGFRLVRDP